MFQPGLRWSQRHLLRGSTVVSDVLVCFNAVTDSGCEHEVHIFDSSLERVEHPALHWINTLLGFVKNTLHGTYHTVRAQPPNRHPTEYHYRFYRRHDPPNLIPKFLYVALRPPQRLLTFSEARW